MEFYQGSIYHVFNKSISGFKILTDWKNCDRFLLTIDYYNNQLNQLSLSKYLIANKPGKYNIDNILIDKEENKTKILAYCLMPDHYHLLLKVKQDKLISKYIGDIENSYTRFFNNRFKRKGPLWQSVFKAVRMKTNWQLLHVSRYIHLNPTTQNLVQKPEEWHYSSYKKFIENDKNIPHEISISKKTTYRQFVENQVEYQKKLKRIRKSILE
ncbi:hypothetical protein GW881_03920 [Candidatus Roizmanbacteria bacterium]|nr:hypothetical protein [Candidatus Roizmanbacteria bacterium]